MAITATVDKFGMTFSEAYHKITRLTYESVDQQSYTYPQPAEPTTDEDGNPVAPTLTQPTVVWVKKNLCYFEVATYASEATREAHAEPIYRSNMNFEATLDAEAADIIVQAYNHLKTQAGYEDAVDC
jgi:hypothetical protein